MKRYADAALDYELARRKMFPPFLRGRGAEFTTAANLRAELASLPADHNDREWHEFELALAERQAVTEPGALFYRILHDEPKAGGKQAETKTLNGEVGMAPVNRVRKF